MEIYSKIFNDESSDDSSFLFESSSSSSTSDSEENVITKIPRIENFLDVIANYTDLEFKQHFRLNRIVADKVINEYINYYQHPRRGGREAVTPNAQIYMTLWFLANTETGIQISGRFNVTQSSVHRILYRVIKWMVENSYKHIKWPTASEIRENQQQFRMIKGLPGVVGAVDCIHIKISCPVDNKQAYLNRKKYYSVLLQGIVNVDKKFIDIHCGEPGSMHDARVFKKSAFYKHMTADKSMIIPGGVLLGDSAYAESNFLVPPFKDYGNLTAEQLKFNNLHSSTRIVVKNAFDLLKSRFHRLKFLETRNIGFISNCIVAACVLHNICISENDICEIENLDCKIDNMQYSTYSDDRNIGSYGEIENLFDKTDNMQNSTHPNERNNRNNGARQKMFQYMNNKRLLN